MLGCASKCLRRPISLMTCIPATLSPRHQKYSSEELEGSNIFALPGRLRPSDVASVARAGNSISKVGRVVTFLCSQRLGVALQNVARDRVSKRRTTDTVRGTVMKGR